MATVLLVSVLATVLVSLAGFFGSSGLAFFFVLVLVYGASLLGLGCVTSAFFNTPKVGELRLLLQYQFASCWSTVLIHCSRFDEFFIGVVRSVLHVC